MPIYNFTHRNKNVEVELDFYNNEVQWFLRYYDGDGLLNEYRIIGYPNVVGQQIEVTFSFSLKRPSNNAVLKSHQDSYYESNLEAFYRMKIGDFEYGHFAGIQAMNGLIARLPVFDSNKDQATTGYRIFDQFGQFYQPVVFDLAIDSETFTQEEGQEVNNSDGLVTVNVLDGVGPYEYQLEQGETVLTPFQSELAIFDNLSAGQYKLSVRDAAGTVRYRMVEIRREFFEELPV